MNKKNYMKLAKAELLIDAYEKGGPIPIQMFQGSNNHLFGTDDYSKLDACSENAEKHSQVQQNGYHVLADKVVELHAKVKKQEKQYNQLVTTIEKREKELCNKYERELHRIKKKYKMKYQKEHARMKKIEKQVDTHELLLFRIIGISKGNPYGVSSLKEANKALERIVNKALPKPYE